MQKLTSSVETGNITKPFKIPKDIDWKLLYTFNVCANSVTLLEASMKLNITGVTIINRISKLEKVCNVPLISKTHGKQYICQLTEYGKYLYSIYKEFNKNLDDAFFAEQRLTDLIKNNELNLLRYFAVTIHYSRFVDAAKALNTSLENLLFHFFNLEKKLHQHLFLRHQGKRILVLTPEGETLKRITQKLYNLED